MAYDTPWRPNAVGLPTYVKFANTVTFSSFSTEPADAWARSVQRPYQIVAFPSYRVPDDLETTYQDSMWLPEPPRQATVVWDGFDPVGLFEVIHECFRYAGPGGMFRVYDVERGVWVEDTRPEALMNARPRKWKGFSWRDQNEYQKAIRAWIRSGPFDHRTGDIHIPAGFDNLIDSITRKRLWFALEMTQERRDLDHGSMVAALQAGALTLPYNSTPIDFAARGREFDMAAREREMAARAAALSPEERGVGRILETLLSSRASRRNPF